MKTALFTTLALLAGISSAHAASNLIDVQFVGYNSYYQTGAALTGNAGNSWNELTYGASNGTDALFYADKSASDVSISYTAQNFWTAPAASYQFAGTSYANLMRTSIAGYGDGIQIDLTGLTAGHEYGFYVYTQGDNGSTGRSLDITANGKDVGTATQTNANTFIEGDNYLYFTTFADSSGDIALDANTLNGEADINGFQMMPVPEPTSLPLIAAGLGALGVVSLRRRRANAR